LALTPDFCSPPGRGGYLRLNDPSPTCVGRKWGSQGDLRLNKGKHTPGPVPQCGRICSYPPSFLGPQHPTLSVVLPFGFLSSRASVWINKALGENCPKRRGIGANSASHTLSDDRADCDIWLPQFLPGFYQKPREEICKSNVRVILLCTS